MCCPEMNHLLKKKKYNNVIQFSNDYSAKDAENHNIEPIFVNVQNENDTN